MAKSPSRPVIGLGQLQRGYGLAVDNALRCFGAAATLLPDFPDKALALAQLGQEEVGKSLTLLAAGSLTEVPASWEWFWSGWRDHQVKAHRAYLYEVIHPLRIEIRHPEGGLYAGEPLLERLSAEKEAGIYVDWDEALRTFVAPQEIVDTFAATARSTTLAYLGATADAVRRAILHADMDFRFREFGGLAYRLCTQEIYQQDWPGIQERFAARSTAHKELIDELTTTLAGVATFFSELERKRRGDRSVPETEA